MFPLAPDPAIALPDEVEAALLMAFRAGPWVRVPVFSGLSSLVLVRWLWRRWIAATGVWRPLVQVAEVSPDAVGAAQLGWLHLITPPAAQVSGALVIVSGPTMDLPRAVVARLQALDQHHLVASDPGLERARRLIEAHARDGASVVLHGPAGSGRRSLVDWAWQRSGQVRPPDPTGADPEAWALLEELPDAARLRARRFDEPSLVPMGAMASMASAPRPRAPAFEAILGESPAISALIRDGVRASRSAAPILLLGEPGTGKELMARALHEASGRPGPFEPLDLAAIPSELVESELFGHERGAFTGAAGDRPGAFRRASGGTLLLDELGNLPLPVQAKLLRVLQEGAVRPVGAERVVKVDVRVIGATHANLDAMVVAGTFRLDLLHRLNAITLRLPPLRERPDDILLLARHFLRQARADGSTPEIAQEAVALLLAWPWPGNVRELWGLMQRVAAFSEPGEPLTAPHLGALARRRHSLPTFILAAGAEASIPRAVRVPVPALSERGPDSLLGAILHFSAGRTLTVGALELLRATPWPDHATLKADLSALLHATPGVIDRVAVERHLGLGPTADAMHVLLGAAGRSLEQRFDVGALVIGRARGWEDLSSGDRAGAHRLVILQELAGESAAFVPFPNEPALSRAHVVVQRGDGLTLHLLPGAGAPTWVTSPGGARRRLVGGRPERVGALAEIDIQLDPTGTRTLRVVVALGEQARARAAGTTPPTTGPLPDTLRDAASSAEGPRGERVWELGPGERALLNEVVLQFRGGDFAEHLRAGLMARVADPAQPRLAAYLLRIRPTQYCARVYQHPLNVALRAELMEQVSGSVDGPGWWATLPAQLRTALTDHPSAGPPWVPDAGGHQNRS